jgi:hypothetical protein
MIEEGKVSGAGKALWFSLMVPQAAVIGFLAYSVGRCLLTLLGVFPSTEVERQGCFVVVPIGTAVAIGAGVTLRGLYRRRKEAFFVSVAFTVLLAMVALTGARRGYLMGTVGLMAVFLLGFLHYLAWRAAWGEREQEGG